MSETKLTRYRVSDAETAAQTHFNVIDQHGNVATSKPEFGIVCVASGFKEDEARVLVALMNTAASDADARIRELEQQLKEAEAKQRVDEQQCDEATDIAATAATRIHELEEACRMLGEEVSLWRKYLTLEANTHHYAIGCAGADVDAHPIAAKYVKEQP